MRIQDHLWMRSRLVEYRLRYHRIERLKSRVAAMPEGPNRDFVSDYLEDQTRIHERVSLDFIKQLSRRVW